MKFKEIQRWIVMSGVIFLILFGIITILIVPNFQESLAQIQGNISLLRATQNNMVITQNQIASTQNKLIKVQSKISNLSSEITELKQNVTAYQFTLELYKERVNQFKERAVTIPTIGQLRAFTLNSHINYNKYLNNSFVCSNFANLFVQKFRQEGYFSCVTEIVFDNDMAHMLVAVNTTDKGVVFVEPQTGQIIYNLSIGEDYEHDYLNLPPGPKITQIIDCYNQKDNTGVLEG